MVRTVRILVVDRDKGMAELLGILLSKNNCRIVHAANSEEAQQSLSQEIPDIVMVDLMQPRAEGIELCKTIRRTNNVPIVFVSALDDPQQIAAALDAGGDDYLVKPISSSMLVARLNKVLRRTSPLPAPHLIS